MFKLRMVMVAMMLASSACALDPEVTDESLTAEELADEAFDLVQPIQPTDGVGATSQDPVAPGDTIDTAEELRSITDDAPPVLFLKPNCQFCNDGLELQCCFRDFEGDEICQPAHC